MASWFETGTPVWQWLLMGNYILVIVLSIVILLKNRNPAKTLAYLFALATLPFLGLLVYYFFGMDWRKDKIFGKKYLEDNDKLREWREGFRPEAADISAFWSGKAPWVAKVHHLLERNQRSVLTFENEVLVLSNGEGKFDRLREDLRRAQSHIHLEYFVVEDDRTGTSILEILCERAREGVKVRLVYDGVGSTISREMKQKLDAAGVEHYAFMPVFFSRFTSKFNYRNHRKIVVIDGTTAYVGGINIRDSYDNRLDNDRYWRDTHLRIEGAAAGSLQADFLLSWHFVSGQEPDAMGTLFPESPPASSGPVAIQVASSGPDSDWANIMYAIFTAVNNARDYVYLSTPYMIPNASMLTALKTAARSGVDVRILIPYRSDSWVAQYATDSYIEGLLEAGVRIFRYTRGFMHAKTMVVDGLFSSVGTANLDYRSFSINFEVNAILYDEGLAETLRDTFMEDLEASEEVLPERWKARGMGRRLQESVNRLWAPLL